MILIWRFIVEDVILNQQENNIIKKRKNRQNEKLRSWKKREKDYVEKYNGIKKENFIVNWKKMARDKKGLSLATFYLTDFKNSLI